MMVHRSLGRRDTERDTGPVSQWADFAVAHYSEHTSSTADPTSSTRYKAWRRVITPRHLTSRRPSDSLKALPPAIMGMSYRQYLTGPRVYGCSTCKTHLASISSMISRVRNPSLSIVGLLRHKSAQAFHGQHGRAYLFDGVCVHLVLLCLARISCEWFQC
jgi:hypothetical protein